MSLLDTIIGVIAPHDCLACDQEGRLVCADCVHKYLSDRPDYCYRCQNPASFSLCAGCLPDTPLESVRAATTYDNVAKELVWRLKFGGAQAAANVIADQMQKIVPEHHQPFIVPVPTATGRTRQRGYDQAKLIACLLAKRTRLPYLDCLRRIGQTHQLGADRQHRLSQLQSAFQVKHNKIQYTRSVILVDDVLTTGATIESAAAVLCTVGIQNIDAVVFAQA